MALNSKDTLVATGSYNRSTSKFRPRYLKHLLFFRVPLSLQKIDVFFQKKNITHTAFLCASFSSKFMKYRDYNFGEE